MTQEARVLIRWTLFAAFNGLASGVCPAAPEEIQVYLDELAEPGQFGLDLHTNAVLSAPPGSPTFHQWRLTPELSDGFSPNWEAGLDVLSSGGPAISQGRPLSDGAKARFKWRPVPASPESLWYFAFNWEVGQRAQRFDPDRSSTQLKLIETYRQGRWLTGVKLNLNGFLRAHPQQASSSELHYRLSYQTGSEGNGPLALGIERYDTLGLLHRNTALASPHTTSNFLMLDFCQAGSSTWMSFDRTDLPLRTATGRWSS